MEIEGWKSEWGELTEGTFRRRLEAEGYSVTRYEYGPGTCFPEHVHYVDKKDAVISGQFLIRAHGREFLLGPGDALPVPAGTVHSAEVIGSQTVISLDGVLPKQR